MKGIRSKLNLVLTIVVFFMFSLQGFSQACDTICGSNLAPNPGFENTTLNCADTVSEIFTDYSQVQGWFGTACSTCPGNGSTPDYYNSLCNGPAQTNNCGSSNGSMGFFTYAIAGANAREYVQAQLTTPLVAGTEYCISIDVKTSNGSFAYKPSDGLGLWFTNQMVDIDVQNGGQMYIGPGSLINATPQIENPSGNFIDTNCVTVTGTFTATGTEQWVVIGNFRNDANTQFNTTCSFFNPCFGYLIVDDISVRTSCNNTPLPVDLQLSTTSDTICEGSCTTLSANVMGGTSPYIITWDNGLPNGNGPHNVCPTTTTTYTAIVTDSLNQSDTTSITLYVNPTDSTTLNTTICSGDSVFAGGNWQNTTGIYYDTLQNLFGCDSIHQTVLNVNPTPSTTQNISLCQGDSLVVGSNTYYSSGNYIDTLVNAAINGCDSIVSTNLTVSTVVTSTSTATICQGDSILLGGAFQTTAGNYNDTIFGGSSSGCDSVHTTTLTVNPIIINSTSATICQGDSILLGGVFQTTSGTYNDTIIGGSSTGCDSIISTTLTVNSIATSIDVITSCAPITWIDGITYSASTSTPTDTLFRGAANGCDSVVTLNLTITTPTTTTNVYNECEGFSVVVGTNTYNTTGIFIDVLNGCDTIITDLTINPAPQLTLIKADDNCGENIGSVSAITSSNNPPITYSWNTGSTDSTISNLPSGTYMITINDASGCANADTVFLDNLQMDCDFFVYTPNVFTPNGDGNNDIFFVRGKGIATMNIKIYNRWGNKVFESSDINQGWDGTFKGKEAPPAVYAYQLKAVCYNGTTYFTKGDVTLIR